MVENMAVGLTLIAINIIISYFGLRNHKVLDKYVFRIENILQGKDYKRMITSGFMHVTWPHLFFNMFSLYMFAELLEYKVGHIEFALIYMSSLIGGNLLALFIHRNHPRYAAAGASGAVCGVIFSTVALEPGIQLGLFFLPIMIPSWLFSLIYVLFTIWGIRSKRDNIGHEAHLGGALVGLLVAIAMHPDVITINYMPILAITVPSLIFIILIIIRPNILQVNKSVSTGSPKGAYTIDDQYNEQKVQLEMEVNRILEKIQRHGVQSLTEREKAILDEFASRN